MFSRRPLRKSNWSAVMMVALLIGSYLVTWMVFRPTIPISWLSSPYRRPSKRLVPSGTTSSDVIGNLNDTTPVNARARCTCPPCYFPPFNCSQEGSVSRHPCPVQPIPCVTNNNSFQKVACVRNTEDGEVFMSTSFINKAFEVYGGMKKESHGDVYNFRFSDATLVDPQPNYDPAGPFLNFDHMYVERRSKIMCVTASDGVPLTDQWEPAGYHYAITIGQYALSHHAKGCLKGNPPPTMVAGGDMDLSRWDTHCQGPDTCSVTKVQMRVGGLSRTVLSFTSPATFNSSGPTLHSFSTHHQSMTVDLILTGPGGITVKIRTKGGKQGYVHYDQQAGCRRLGRYGHVYYGMETMNKTPRWIHLARDIAADWWKAYPASPFESILAISLHGSGYLDNVTSATSIHLEHLVQAADWLVSNQDERGGWPTKVSVRTGPIHLKAGWYSAMGQGQAMSALVRAYNVTGQETYLTTAIRAAHLFTVPSSQGGVLARFMGVCDWYEEYPTTPGGTFVLNGFIFSLFGLYDVMQTANGGGRETTKRLWNNGLASLKSMLGMFDSGTGSFYDLRHVTHHEQPNRARWDYHAVHVALLQQMASVDGDPLFTTTLNRWKGYFHGNRSKHN